VILETSVLIECDYQHGIIPGWTGSKGFIHIFDQSFTFGDGGSGMLPIGKAETLWVVFGCRIGCHSWFQKGLICQIANFYITLEVSHILDSRQILRFLHVLQVNGEYRDLVFGI